MSVVSLQPASPVRDEVPTRERPATPALSALLDGLLEAVWLLDAHSRCIVAVNRAATQLLGRHADSLLGQSIDALVNTPEDALFWMEAAHDPAATLYSDTVMLHADGRLLFVTRRISLISTGHPGANYWLIAMRDQTGQRQSEEQRESLVAELKATLESTADGILVADLGGRVRSFNRRFAVLWGVPEDLLQGHPDDRALQQWMRQSVIDSEPYALRLAAIQDAPLLESKDIVHLKGGRVLERVSLPQFSRSAAVGRVFSFRDLSDVLAAHQRIEEMACCDMLTGLPNRRALAERVDHAQAVARREGAVFALLNVDLDRFQQINDTLGQSYGDRVLKEVSGRLKACLREVDTVARLGGDEFALLIHQADARGAEHAARRVQAAMSSPFSFDTLSFTVTCSTGIALFPADGGTADELMASAERAMHWVKESGRSAFRFHQPRKDVDLLSRMQLDHAMRQALQEGQFRLHYQPQIALATGRVIGAKALLRWRDPLRGEISPAEFIPVAEESGFVVPIGEWVLQQAVEQAARWLRKGWPLPVAVNVSALQFQQTHFVEQVAQVLRDARLPPALLELELTEGILLRDAQEALHRLQALSALGIGMSIDDFGTGYSSLSYLKRFPIQRLKIDRSFITGLPGDASDAGIVNAIIQMGRALHLHVIAEGVETEAQRDFLSRAGCDDFQGYLYAPALDPRSFEERVWQSSRTPPTRSGLGVAGGRMG